VGLEDSQTPSAEQETANVELSPGSRPEPTQELVESVTASSAEVEMPAGQVEHELAPDLEPTPYDPDVADASPISIGMLVFHIFSATAAPLLSIFMLVLVGFEPYTPSDLMVMAVAFQITQWPSVILLARYSHLSKAYTGIGLVSFL